MKEKYLIYSIVFIIIFYACASTTSLQKTIHRGEYEQPIQLAVHKLSKNKNNPKFQEYIPILEEAYRKATDKDLSQIAYCIKEGSPQSNKIAFDLYHNIRQRQAKIRPLLPLHYATENRNTTISLQNYDQEFLALKSKVSEDIYQEGVYYLRQDGEQAAIQANEVFTSLNSFAPNYKDTSDKLIQSNQKIGAAIYSKGMELMDSNEGEASAIQAYEEFLRLQDFDADYPNITAILQKAKNKVGDAIVHNANTFLEVSSKVERRKGYEELLRLQRFDPEYHNVSKLLENAKNEGTTYVYVVIENQTAKVIPERLQEELLDFDTYYLDDFWTEYHNNSIQNINYDYDVILSFESIDFSPEREKETRIIQEKEIKDGWQFQEDSEGNIVKDSIGNPIKMDKFRMVSGELQEFIQTKNVHVKAQVKKFKISTGQQIYSQPLTSSFVFEHYYANYYGDMQALDDNYQDSISQKALPFPSNAQMLLDAGEDIKIQLKGLLIQMREYL